MIKAMLNKGFWPYYGNGLIGAIHLRAEMFDDTQIRIRLYDVVCRNESFLMAGPKSLLTDFFALVSSI